MKTTRLFRIIWRANAVIIFGAGLAALLVVAIAGYFTLREVTRERTVDAVVNTETGQRVEESVALAHASEISGHPWLLVPLESDQHYGEIYFSKSTNAARNYAFVSRSVEVRWLYPHSRFLILNAIQLDGPEPDVTALVAFEVVQRDTDGNKRLTDEDATTLVFTRPDGTGATPVLENVSDVLSQALMGEEILVIYEDRDGYAVATFSLKDFSLIKRERVALPPVGS